MAAAIVLVALTAGGIAAAASPPKLDAKAWALIDARTGEVLTEKAPDRHLPMASTTKMMTAYLAMKNLNLAKKYPAANYQADPAESLMGLETGQMVSGRDLLYGLILLSGNDAAVTLAEAVSGTEKKFVALMNRTAGRLGLEDTHYENPVGLDGKQHYSSARDLASLGQNLMALPRFRPIASARTATLTSYTPPIEIQTHNDFVLGNAWAKGIKTGHTMKAGYVLASDGRRRATELIGAVIGTPTELARDAETVKLLDYGFSLYNKQVPIRQTKPVVRIPVKYQGEDLAVVSPTSVRIGTRKGEKLQITKDLPDEVEGPVRKNELIGSATVTVDGEKVSTVKLLAARSIAEASLAEKLKGQAIFMIISLLIVLFAILGLVALIRHRREARMRGRLRRVTRRRR
ncbi:MAG: D-alanyl-D-alanine carboxypeptidase family protein [Solirubrobacterales bacterium]